MKAAPDFRNDRILIRIWLPLLLLFSITGNASANAGTPLILSGAFHLLLGNLMIGICEGMLLSTFFGANVGRTFPTMILANYVSAWTAVGLLGLSAGWRNAMDLDNFRAIFCAMVAAAWVFTILLEWPFIRFCFRSTPNPWRKSLGASLVIQTVTYVLMMAWYWLVSGTSLLTGVTVVNPEDFKLPPSVEIYYIDPADGDAYRRPISGGVSEKVSNLDSKGWGEMLFATAPVDGHTSLRAAMLNPTRSIEVIGRLPVTEATAQERNTSIGTWFNFGKALKLGSPGEKWEFASGLWGAEGLHAKNRTSGETVRVSLETPFLIWYARNAVHLPGDLVLFQLGENQICVFDPATRRIARLWHGRGFVAVIPRNQ